MIDPPARRDDRSRGVVVLAPAAAPDCENEVGRGGPGRIIPRTGRASSRPSPGSMRRSCACSRRMSGCIFWSRTPRPNSARSGILERAGANLDRVSFHQWPTDRGWTRDSGPIFVRNAGGPGRHHQLALQRLGQVLRLASRRPGAGPRGGAAWLARVAASHRIARRLQRTAGPRRRLHRYQRRGHFCSPPRSAC